MSDSDSGDDCPNMALMVITRSGDKVKIREFDNKREMKKKFKALVRRSNTVVILKNGRIGKCSGNKREVCTSFIACKM